MYRTELIIEIDFVFYKTHSHAVLCFNPIGDTLTASKEMDGQASYMSFL